METNARLDRAVEAHVARFPDELLPLLYLYMMDADEAAALVDRAIAAGKPLTEAEVEALFPPDAEI